MIKYFYDTYAIIEYIKGNPAFKKYFKEPIGITTKLNLIELYYILIDDQELANDVFDSFSTVSVDIDENQIKNAMKLRKKLKMKGLNISYADAVGYSLALEMGVKFLTGDREFKKLGNVEYVK